MILSSRNHTCTPRGNTILELLIAIAVLAVVLTAIVYSMTTSIKNSDEAEYRQVANRLAQEVIELLRYSKSNQGWEVFATTPADGSYCLASDFAGNTSVGVPTELDEIGATCPVYDNSALGMEYRRALTKERTDNQVKYTIHIHWNVQAGSPEQLRTTQIEQIFYRTE